MHIRKNRNQNLSRGDFYFLIWLVGKQLGFVFVGCLVKNGMYLKIYDMAGLYLNSCEEDYTSVECCNANNVCYGVYAKYVLFCAHNTKNIENMEKYENILLLLNYFLRPIFHDFF